MSARPRSLPASSAQKGRIAAGFDADLVGLGSGRAVHGRGRALVLSAQSLTLPWTRSSRAACSTRCCAANACTMASSTRRVPWDDTSSTAGRHLERREHSRRGLHRPGRSGARWSAAKHSATSDDFFAGMDNLLQPGRAVFIAGQVHRARQVDGRLGEPPQARPRPRLVRARAGRAGLGARVRHRHPALRRQPPAVRVGRGHFRAARHAAPGAAERANSTSSCRKCRCCPNSQNLFVASARRGRQPPAPEHLSRRRRGALPRLRQRVCPRGPRPSSTRWPRAHVPPGCFDLAALENGALALACSDALFGRMNNLLLPGRAENMGAGWETRRRRGPGSDWILIRLGARGTPTLARGRHQPLQGQLPGPLLGRRDRRARRAPHRSDREQRLATALGRDQAARRHAALLRRASCSRPAPATHVRLRIFPDGGVSRLRVWGSLHG